MMERQLQDDAIGREEIEAAMRALIECVWWTFLQEDTGERVRERVDPELVCGPIRSFAQDSEIT